LPLLEARLPMHIKDPWIKALVIVMLIIAAVYLTGLLWQVAIQFADVILLFFLAWVISFMLEPLVAALHVRARLPRNLAVLAAYVTVLVVVSLIIIQFVPPLSAQMVQFANDLPMYADWIGVELLRLQAVLAGKGLSIAPDSIISYQEAVRRIESLGPLLLANTVGLATGVANLLFQVFIILILSYYMTLDGRRISDALLLAVPRAYRHDAGYFFVSINRAFAGFMRGQLAQAAIYGLGTAAVMSVAGLKLVLLPSVVAGLFMLLPFIGPFLAMVLPLVVAAATKPDSFWIVLVALFILQQIVVNVVAPRLMSHTVGLHPLLVFFAVLGGAKVAGIWGALFGVPIVAVAAAMASFYHATVEDRQARLREAAVEPLPEEEPPTEPLPEQEPSTPGGRLDAGVAPAPDRPAAEAPREPAAARSLPRP
jgi:predicted PurR-regulated permease PerM